MPRIKTENTSQYAYIRTYIVNPETLEALSPKSPSLFHDEARSFSSLPPPQVTDRGSRLLAVTLFGVIASEFIVQVEGFSVQGRGFGT